MNETILQCRKYFLTFEVAPGRSNRGCGAADWQGLSLKLHQTQCSDDWHSSSSNNGSTYDVAKDAAETRWHAEVGPSQQASKCARPSIAFFLDSYKKFAVDHDELASDATEFGRE